jgi:hypothetical protein
MHSKLQVVLLPQGSTSLNLGCAFFGPDFLQPQFGLYAFAYYIVALGMPL